MLVCFSLPIIITMTMVARSNNNLNLKIKAGWLSIHLIKFNSNNLYPPWCKGPELKRIFNLRVLKFVCLLIFIFIFIFILIPRYSWGTLPLGWSLFNLIELTPSPMPFKGILPPLGLFLVLEYLLFTFAQLALEVRGGSFLLRCGPK